MRTTFYSPHRHLIINAEPEVRRIEFVHGLFATEDPEQIELLRKHPGYGRYIFENQSVVAQQAEETKPAQQPQEDDKGPHVCPECGREFDSKRGLETHFRQKHPDSDLL